MWSEKSRNPDAFLPNWVRMSDENGEWGAWRIQVQYKEIKLLCSKQGGSQDQEIFTTNFLALVGKERAFERERQWTCGTWVIYERHRRESSESGEIWYEAFNLKFAYGGGSA